MKRMRLRLAVAGVLLWGLGLGAGVVWGQTGGNVTWTNGGATVFWNDTGNWVGGLYPDNPTAGRVIYDVPGQAMVGKLETDRTIGGIGLGVGWNAWSAGQSHTLDLNGYRLTIAGHLRIDQAAANSYMTFTNGTVQIGTDSVEGNLELFGLYGGNGAVTFTSGAILDSYRMGTLRIGSTDNGSNRGGNWLDLRGAAVAGGVLTVKDFYITTKQGQYTGLRFDSTNVLHTLVVSNILDIGDSAHNGGNAFIGNTTDYKLPSGVNVRVGTSPAARATRLRIGHGGHLVTSAQLTASDGGWFKAYVTDLTIGDPGRHGTLDIRAMTNCVIDATTFVVGKESGVSSATPVAQARLCPGTVTAGTVALGSTVSGGYALLEMSNTLFTVTGTYTLNTTGTNLIWVGADSRGLDVQGTIVDEGGHIHVNFTEEPVVGTTNWAVRAAGDARGVVAGLVGGGRLTSSGTFAGWKTGVVYDGAYTYFGLVDEATEFPPIAVARNRTFEIETGGTVLVGIADIDNGSYDPDGRTPVVLSLSKDGAGGPFSESLSFTAQGDHEVTLKIEVGDPVEDSATDTATVSIVPLPAGVATDVTWSGGAGSSLMTRPEWMWSGNWAGGAPPANPTTATIYYKTSGQSRVGRIETPRTVGGIMVGEIGAGTFVHTLDLGATILTLAGNLGFVTQAASTLALTNGTLRIGSDAVEGNLLVGDQLYGGAVLLCRAGTIIDTYRVGTLRAGAATGGSNAQSAQIDLRNATIAGGVLRVRDLIIGTRFTSYVALDETTTISGIVVSNSLMVGESGYGGTAYIGNPADANRRLPANVSLQVGSSPTARGSLQIGRNTDATQTLTATLAASSGGSFTAWLSDLKIVPYESGYSGDAQQNGTLDLSGMTNCAVDALSILVAPNDSANASAQPRGTLKLPTGTVTVGTVEIGGALGTGFGLLEMSNTVFTVTNTLTVAKTGQIVIHVGAGQPSGIHLTRDDPGSLSLDPAATITVRFLAPPTQGGLHYGLRLAGDRVSELTGMGGNLVIDSSGLPEPAEIMLHQGDTYVGWMPPPAGTVIMIR